MFASARPDVTASWRHEKRGQWDRTIIMKIRGAELLGWYSHRARGGEGDGRKRMFTDTWQDILLS